MPETNIRIAARDQASGTFSRVAQKSQMMRTSFAATGASMSRMMGTMGTLVGVGGFGALIKQSIDSADKIQKLSIRLGASTEALSEYQHVADLSGVTFETLTMAWQRMSRRVADASKGMGEARGALQALGLDAKELSTLKPEQQFERITQAMQGMEGQSLRLRTAFKLFDSEGVRLLQIIDAGPEKIAKLREEAKRLGKSIGKDFADQAASFNDDMTRMRAQITGFATDIAKYWLPKIQSMTSSIEPLLVKMNELSSFSSEQRSKFAVNQAIAEAQKHNAEIRASYSGGKKIHEMAPITVKARKPDGFIEGFIQRATVGKEVMKDFGHQAAVDMQKLSGLTAEMAEESAANMSRLFKLGVQAATDASKAMGNAMEDFFFDAIDGRIKSTSDYFSAFLKDIAKSMASQLSGQISAGIFGSFAGIGARANGGPVLAGSPYVVGERGPELFVPRTSGSIIPNGMGKTKIEIINHSGVPMEASTAYSSSDGEDMILGVVLKAMQTNRGGARDAMKAFTR